MVEKIFALAGTWATMMGGIWVLFQAAEKTATPDGKKRVSDWLKNLAAKSISETIVESPKWFIEMFDRFFGEKHLTKRCFFMSSMASFISVFVITIIWVILFQAQAQEFSYLFQLTLDRILFEAFIIALILNILPDYFSLLETRYILKNMERGSLKRLTMILFLDVIFSGGIFILFALFFFYILGDLNLDEITINTIFEDFIFFEQKTSRNLSVFFYSTYFTSIWMYLFMISSIITKVLYSFGKIGNWLMSFFDITKKPFQSIGVFSMVFITLIFLLFY